MLCASGFPQLDAASASERIPLCVLSMQIHCRYRANERNEAKRKGRHTGTGAFRGHQCYVL